MPHHGVPKEGEMLSSVVSPDERKYMEEQSEKFNAVSAMLQYADSHGLLTEVVITALEACDTIEPADERLSIALSEWDM